ncbi:hypothetical protein RC083_01440 [Pseudoalteromonas haloplanktis]|uniref:Uncharacterized protein n=1 Tax=Pseudoalteromonas haloplanktis TaxID=228 RepID=A0ABU1B8I9_PSEHA|nr:hypothetical protein [Pseudoalteromonas haloplanktis]MDQ9090249.1 hypothetical protein [Pseudoalteromonas haloplanktis]
MIKRILLATCLVTSPSTLAAEQYSQAQCDRIEAERENIRDRMRSSYSTREGERLRQRATELFKELGRYCKNPKRRGSSSASPRYSHSSANDLLNKKVHDSTVYNKTYDSDRKRLAWSNFYQYPQRCRANELQQADFVWCSENRAEQRARFEAQWQPPTKVNIHLHKPEVTKPQVNLIAVPVINHSMTLTPVSNVNTSLMSTSYEEEKVNYKIWQLVVVGCLAFIGVFGFYRWFKD